MKHVQSAVAMALLGATVLSGCSKSGDKKTLTREVFAAAVSKCQPLDAKFVSNADGLPSVEITVPKLPSTVPDCMAREFDGYALKAIQININTGQVQAER